MPRSELLARMPEPNQIILVTLRKGNHLGGTKWEEINKSFIEKRERLLEEVEIQCKALV